MGSKFSLTFFGVAGTVFQISRGYPKKYQGEKISLPKCTYQKYCDGSLFDYFTNFVVNIYGDFYRYHGYNILFYTPKRLFHGLNFVVILERKKLFFTGYFKYFITGGIKFPRRENHFFHGLQTFFVGK